MEQGHIVQLHRRASRPGYNEEIKRYLGLDAKEGWAAKLRNLQVDGKFLNGRTEKVSNALAEQIRREKGPCIYKSDNEEDPFSVEGCYSVKDWIEPMKRKQLICKELNIIHPKLGRFHSNGDF